MAACDKSLDHVRAFSIVIPAERSGPERVADARERAYGPDRESRNPVDTGLACRVGCARPLCKRWAGDYWIPARASPAKPGSLGRDDSPYAIALLIEEIRRSEGRLCRSRS